MIQHLGEINGVMQGVGVIVGSQRPFVRFLVANWPLAMVAGLAIAGRFAERYKKGELTAYNALADAGLMLSPLVGIALLNQLATDRADREQMLLELQAQNNPGGAPGIDYPAEPT